jgi:hypothetical protein
VAIGELAVTVTEALEPPLLVSVNTVTATLLSVMNFLCKTVHEPPVCWLRQWLGYCMR